MEKSAVIHKMDKEYFYCIEKGLFVVRLQTKKGDAAKVVLHYQDKYIKPEMFDTRVELPMDKVASDGINDYYEALIKIDVICLRYWFEIVGNDGTFLYYGSYYFKEKHINDTNFMFDCPQASREEDIFEIPDWAPGAVVYSIFPDRFATDSDLMPEKWYHTPVHWRDKLHGNLKGIIQKIDHIKDLGIDVIYLTPIFRSDSNHKYDTIDYFQIDPDFGSKDDLVELVKKAHAVGLKVMIDGVFNHTGAGFFAFQDLLKNQEKSRYKDWFYIDRYPVELPKDRSQRPNYRGFSYYGGMPKLNCHTPEVQDFIIQVAKYWLRECQIDGWRLDVADEIGHDFWKRFRKEVKKENPKALIVGEIWHMALPFLQGDEWDSVMNYRFRTALVEFLASENMSAQEFVNDFEFVRGNVNVKAHQVLWNLIDSHDTARFLHLCKEDKRKLKCALALQMISSGMPMIYYGDEYAMTGGEDPECRRGMLWDENNQDPDMFAYYKQLIQIRKNSKAFSLGTVSYPRVDNYNRSFVMQKVYKEEAWLIVVNGSENTVMMPECNGKMDEISKTVLTGEVRPYQVVIMKQK